MCAHCFGHVKDAISNSDKTSADCTVIQTNTKHPCLPLTDMSILASAISENGAGSVPSSSQVLLTGSKLAMVDHYVLFQLLWRMLEIMMAATAVVPTEFARATSFSGVGYQPMAQPQISQKEMSPCLSKRSPGSSLMETQSFSKKKSPGGGGAKSERECHHGCLQAGEQCGVTGGFNPW